MTARRARNLASAGISRVQVSLDGLAEAHDRIRQREGLFNRAHRAIENSRSVNIKTRACFADRRGNVNEMGQVFEFCRSAGVDGFNLSQLVPAGRGDRSMDLLPEQWRDVLLWWNEMRLKFLEIRMTEHLAQLVLVAPNLVLKPQFRGCQAGQSQGAMAGIKQNDILGQPLRDSWLASAEHLA